MDDVWKSAAIESLFVRGQIPAGGGQRRARAILQELASIGARLAECEDFTCPITLQVGQLPPDPERVVERKEERASSRPDPKRVVERKEERKEIVHPIPAPQVEGGKKCVLVHRRSESSLCEG